MYQRILVANRGEIALRIIRACRELGIETVAIFSEGDRGARYLELADEAYCVGPAKAADSYLRSTSVISAAEVGNVQAIHPGYGFLAENAHFNEICRSCKIDFIGPTPEAMARLGDKNAARELAREAEVPVVPGSDGLIDRRSEALRFAHEIGFPVLIKASAGGGGRGMRVALERPGAQVGAAAGPGRGRGRVRQRRRLPGKIHRASAARRSAGPRRPSRQRGPSVGARLQRAAAASEADRRKPLHQHLAGNADGDVRRGRAADSARPNYTNAGTVEFIVDQQTASSTSSRSTPAFRSSIRSPKWSPAST